jgi:hypothetical protein
MVTMFFWVLIFNGDFRKHLMDLPYRVLLLISLFQTLQADSPYRDQVSTTLQW